MSWFILYDITGGATSSFDATGRIVAHAVVGKDGSFETTAPLPPQAMFATHRRANTVRYRAEIGEELSEGMIRGQLAGSSGAHEDDRSAARRGK